MFEYFKRKFFRLSGNIKVDTYPQYYEKNGHLIREESNGTRYVITLDENFKETIIGEYKHD